MGVLERADPEVAAIIRREEERQTYGLEMMASENYVSAAVLEAMGSVLTNKYAEGYPGKRYYGGCQYMDEIESLAIRRAKELFGAEHVNVQPHSGADANLAAYLAMMELGDTALAMRLDQGGHLTHGHSVSATSRLFRFVHYGVDRETELLDYDQMLALAREHRPKVIVVGATAYPRIIDFARAREIADEVGAYLMADIAHIAGLVAAGVHPSPVPYAHVVTTTTHKTLRGPRSAMVMCKGELAEKIDRAVFPGLQGGPHMHIIAAKAVCFAEAQRPEFVHYQRRTVENARALAEELMSLGWRIVSGGTDNHLVLVDVGQRGISGKKAEQVLDAVGIYCNKNTIPYDPRPPAVGSGIRLGTPGLTSRGMGTDEMRRIARLIDAALQARDDGAALERVRAQVRELAAAFPVPGISDRAP
ncbi:MAG: serine hydroxymethyltransferase [Dehalococcoidia bacterium]|jgi:glycine hydroxymethyltransferase|nr:serine hydroxymethyltransferase [Dehalococcoidia bacterium]MDW8008223.1 serine hydroxymethyltransferase [Chloroflexota bacterium]